MSEKVKKKKRNKENQAGYVCRRCGSLQQASPSERMFGRIVCPMCGGTCDPNKYELASLDARRTKFSEQSTRHHRYAGGHGTNHAIGKDD